MIVPDKIQLSSYEIVLVVSVTAMLTKTADAQGVRPADVTAFRGQQVMFNCSGSIQG